MGDRDYGEVMKKIVIGTVKLVNIISTVFLFIMNIVVSAMSETANMFGVRVYRCYTEDFSICVCETSEGIIKVDKVTWEVIRNDTHLSDYDVSIKIREFCD